MWSKIKIINLINIILQLFSKSDALGTAVEYPDDPYHPLYIPDYGPPEPAGGRKENDFGGEYDYAGYVDHPQGVNMNRGEPGAKVDARPVKTHGDEQIPTGIKPNDNKIKFRAPYVSNNFQQDETVTNRQRYPNNVKNGQINFQGQSSNFQRQNYPGSYNSNPKQYNPKMHGNSQANSYPGQAMSYSSNKQGFGEVHLKGPGLYKYLPRNNKNIQANKANNLYSYPENDNVRNGPNNPGFHNPNNNKYAGPGYVTERHIQGGPSRYPNQIATGQNVFFNINTKKPKQELDTVENDDDKAKVDEFLATLEPNPQIKYVRHDNAHPQRIVNGKIYGEIVDVDKIKKELTAYNKQLRTNQNRNPLIHNGKPEASFGPSQNSFSNYDEPKQSYYEHYLNYLRQRNASDQNRGLSGQPENLNQNIYPQNAIRQSQYLEVQSQNLNSQNQGAQNQYQNQQNQNPNEQNQSPYLQSQDTNQQSQYSNPTVQNQTVILENQVPYQNQEPNQQIPPAQNQNPTSQSLPAQNMNPNQQIPPAQNQIPNSQIPPAQNQFPNPQIPPAQNQFPDPQIPPAQNQIPNPQIPTAQNQIPNPEIPPAQNQIPNPQTSPEQNQIPNTQTLPAQNQNPNPQFLPSQNQDSNPQSPPQNQNPNQESKPEQNQNFSQQSSPTQNQNLNQQSLSAQVQNPIQQSPQAQNQNPNQHSPSAQTTDPTQQSPPVQHPNPIPQHLNPNTQKQNSNSSKPSAGGLDYNDIPGWYDAEFPTLTSLPQSNMSVAPDIITANGASILASKPPSPNPLILEAKNAMAANHMGYFTGYLNELFRVLRSKQIEHSEALFIALKETIDTMVTEGKLADMGNPAQQALQNALKILVGWEPAQINSQLQTASILLEQRQVVLAEDVLQIVNIIDAAYTIEEGEQLLQTLVNIAAFPAFEQASEVAKIVVDAILLPYWKTPALNRARLFEMINSALDRRYNFDTRRHNGKIAEKKGDRNNINSEEYHTHNGDANDNILKIMLENFIKGTIVNVRDGHKHTFNKDKQVNTIQSNTYNKIEKQTGNNNSDDTSTMKMKDEKKKRIGRHEFGVRNQEHRIEIDKRYYRARINNINTIKSNKSLVNHRIQEKNRHEDKMNNSKNNIANQNEYEFPTVNNAKKNEDGVLSIEEIYKKDKTLKTNARKKLNTKAEKYADKRKTHITTPKLKTKHNRYDRLKQYEYNYEKSLRNRHKDHEVSIRRDSKAKTDNKKQLTTRKEVTKKKINKTNVINTKVFEIVSKGKVIETSDGNVEEADTYDKGIRNKIEITTQKSTTEQINKTISKYLDPIPGKINYYHNKKGFVNKKEKNKIKSIVKNIIGESSYSDEEKELKFVLADAIRHGDVVFKNFRKSDDVVKAKRKMNVPSSYSDEEGILKNNIYKVFGYDPDLDLRKANKELL